VITVQAGIYRDLGLPDLTLLINSVGSGEARAAYRDALVEYLTPFRGELDGGERIEVAGVSVDVLSTPGHSPGHLTFLVDGIKDAAGDGYEQPPVAFVGDVIFQGSVGRTDLPFSDGATLGETLEQLRVRLDPSTILCSGHGPVTTMANELASNPFLRR
jgi:glyoxylase-like metal-dependent hydrolase (beta-lactamase superfamily II)